MVTDRTRAELEEAKAACAQAERELRQAHARLEAAHQRLGDVTQQWEREYNADPTPAHG